MLAAGLLASCGEVSSSPGAGTAEAGGAAAVPSRLEAPIFEDVAESTGLRFVHRNGARGELLFPEVMGSGVALFDFDADGDQDVYLVQGDERGESAAGDRLFRNELLPSGELRFRDVTEAAGIVARGNGMGVAVGDVDNDGCYDLYVVNEGPNQLWRNRCDGTFEEVTARAGVGDPRWGVSASFVDLDDDGFLDLYVANYVILGETESQTCSSPSGIPEYCSPLAFEPEVDTLYRNRGDGTFEDVSESAGIRSEAENGLGVVALDLDRNGRSDLYVANDMTPNLFWVNQGDGSFKNLALLTGTAVNRNGRSEASMGIAVGDVDRDGDEDLLVTHLRRESHTLYLNRGDGSFEDDTPRFGLEGASNEATGFGTHFFDFDQDGFLDLVACNGAVSSLRERIRPEDEVTLAEPNQLFHNTGEGFVDVSAVAGPGFTDAEVSRGLAVGDLDNDGRPDLVITNNAGPARVLVNRLQTGRRWLGVRVFDERYKRDALGAVVAVTLHDGTVLRRTVRVDGSYASSSDPRLLFGLGETGEVQELEVTWPDGWSVAVDSPDMDRYLELRRPAEVAPETPP